MANKLFSRQPARCRDPLTPCSFGYLIPRPAKNGQFLVFLEAPQLSTEDHAIKPFE